jgi:monoamine oxidase
MDADVIVIGAGAAGLAAARDLANQRLRVIVLEARDRTGGRVREDRSIRTNVSAELGAEFIHGPAKNTMAVLREIGGKTIAMTGESWVCEKGELRQDESDMRQAARLFERARALETDESVERFLQRFEGDPALKETLRSARAFVEGFEAAEPSIASVKSIGDEVGSGTDYASTRPLGGYWPIFEHLQKTTIDAGVRIHLATAVRKITWRRGAVDVDAKTSWGEAHALRARAAIVTLPVGVLRHSADETKVEFEPPIPAAKRRALANIEMGRVVRVVLWFRTPFWEQINHGRYRDADFFRCPEHPYSAYWTQSPVVDEQVVAWAGGPKATALGSASQQELIEKALDGFGALLGESALAHQAFEGGVMHDWDHDPFSRGAYSYVIVGGGNARATLAQPVDDTLFFAGEATSTDGNGGTVNGALETGERAAREAAASLGIIAR